MRKLRAIQIGVEHAHALAAKMCLTQMDMFEFVGYTTCGKDYPYKNLYDGIKEYSLEEILCLSDIDVAMIECEETELTKYAKMAIKKNINVYIDKPGGAEDEEFSEMVDLAKEKGLVVFLGYMYRYNKAVIDAKEKIKNGDLGEIYSVEAQMNCHLSPKERQRMENYPGGMMYFLGCHLIDIIFSICGEPEDVISLNTTVTTDSVTAKDYGFAVLKYKNGLSFAKTCAAEVGGFSRRQIVICGSKGTYEINPVEIIKEGKIQPIISKVSETYCNNDGMSDWCGKGEFYETEISDRYMGMFETFYKVVTKEIKNAFSYEYEKALHKVLMKACGSK